MNKKFIVKLFLIALLILSASVESEAKLSMLCTLYPQFDFARAVASDLADVKLLLKPGVEPHEFEPSIKDIQALNNSDLIIYTGPLMEIWAERIFNALDGEHKVLNLSEGIEIFNNDPHIWLDMSNAVIMVEKIKDALCKIDPDNSQQYILNSERYIEKLNDLDQKFMAFKDREVIFAGEFAYYYFVRRYSINYLSAYNGETEPGIKRAAEIIKHVRENNIKYIFCDAFEISSISEQIAKESGADILILNTAHNVLDLKITFLEIMNENLKNLKLALSDE